MFGLVWSVGCTGVEAGQKAFLEFLSNITADLGMIETEWEGVSNALQVKSNASTMSGREKGRGEGWQGCEMPELLLRSKRQFP